MAVPTAVPEDIRAAFGAWLRARRKERGLSQEEAARLAGISRQHWMRMEAGESGTRRETLPRIAEAMGVSVSEALSRAGFVSEAGLDEIRELEFLLCSIPQAKRAGFLRAVRVMAETLSAA